MLWLVTLYMQWYRPIWTLYGLSFIVVDYFVVKQTHTSGTGTFETCNQKEQCVSLSVKLGACPRCTTEWIRTPSLLLNSNCIHNIIKCVCVTCYLCIVSWYVFSSAMRRTSWNVWNVMWIVLENWYNTWYNKILKHQQILELDFPDNESQK